MVFICPTFDTPSHMSGPTIIYCLAHIIISFGGSCPITFVGKLFIFIRRTLSLVWSRPTPFHFVKNARKRNYFLQQQSENV
jgi:hypothetical protein